MWVHEGHQEHYFYILGRPFSRHQIMIICFVVDVYVSELYEKQLFVPFSSVECDCYWAKYFKDFIDCDGDDVLEKCS